jgi:hypothetical protein
MKTLQELTQELDDADQALQAAQLRSGHARREETEATNRLNEAQKAFDARVSEMRKTSPHGSDWHTKVHSRPVLVEETTPGRTQFVEGGH